MAIINTTPRTPPTPTELLAKQAAHIESQANQAYRQLGMLFQHVARFCWKNPMATPQQAFDAFGTNAGDLLKLAEAYSAFIKTYTGTAPASPVPSGWSYTVENGGSVTVVGPPPTRK